MQDADLIVLTKIPQLSSLSLIGSPITDAAVPTLAKLQQLQELFVGGTRLTAAGIAELKRELPKARLDQDRPVQLPAESRDDAFPPEE